MKYIIFSLIIHIGFSIGMYFDAFKSAKDETPNVLVNISFNVIEKQEPMIAKSEEPISEPQSNELPPPVIEPVVSDPPVMKLPEPKKVQKKETKSKEKTKKVDKQEPKNIVEKTSDTIPSKVNTDMFADNKNFRLNGDGTYTALSSKGINYKVILSPEPNYPARANSARYNRDVTVRAKFIVGLKGNVESIQIISGNSGMGFDDEVRKTLNKWKYQPIYYNNKNIKVTFTKTFYFKSRF